MKLLIAMIVSLTICSSAVPQGTRIVTAAEANGTYRYRRNEIKIQALGHNKLRIQMSLTYEYKISSGPMANVGEASGEATIENDVAVFHPPDTQDCTITIKFLRGNKIKVSEDRTINCGFGMNVSSEGTYTKIKSGKPKFDSDN
ncbi:MAG: hypothetical protein QOH71_3872 [Blastocatellia bacterium]|jgi:hypothetical protein|nr:hypothetical protein [Blastocatellia bacterium]